MVSLEPVQRSEIGKKRPALVISNNRNNQFAETITVIPLNSRADKLYPLLKLPSRREQVGFPPHPGQSATDKDCLQETASSSNLPSLR